MRYQTFGDHSVAPFFKRQDAIYCLADVDLLKHPKEAFTAHI